MEGGSISLFYPDESGRDNEAAGIPTSDRVSPDPAEAPGTKTDAHETEWISASRDT